MFGFCQGMRTGCSPHPGGVSGGRILERAEKNCYSLDRAEFQFRQGERGFPAADVSRGSRSDQGWRRRLQLENTFGSQLIKRVAIRKIQNKYLCPESIILLFKDRHICQVKSSFTFKGDPLCIRSWLWEQYVTRSIFSMLRTVLGFLWFQLLFAEFGMSFTFISYFPSLPNCGLKDSHQAQFGLPRQC